MQYTETKYKGKFNEFILNFWKFQVPDHAKPFLHESMPENTVSIVFIYQPNYKCIRILGPQTKKNQQHVYPGSVYLGIRFNPWVKIDSLFGAKSSIVNKTVDAPGFVSHVFREINLDLLPSDFSGYHLFEKGFQRLVEGHNVVSEPLSKFICLRLEEGIKIQELVKEIPLSVRPIQKHFKSVTGLTMTDYRNILRFQNTVRTIYMKKESITNAAFEYGYTDHAHYINSFKKYMESTSMKDFFLMTDKISLSIE